MADKKHPQHADEYRPSKYETAGEEMLAFLKLKASKENKAVGPSLREAGLR